MADVLSKEELEVERLHYWNIGQLLGLGFERHQAEILELAHVDWHDAEDLLDQNCSHELVIEILS